MNSEIEVHTFFRIILLQYNLNFWLILLYTCGPQTHNNPILYYLTTSNI